MNEYLESLDLPSVATGAAVAFLLTFTVGRLACRKIAQAARESVFREMSRTSAVDQSNYLGVLKRELANEFVRRNPRQYLRNYYHLLDEVERIKTLTKDEAVIRYAALSQQYKNYSDFDIVEVRDYVLYADALDWIDDEEMIRTYNDIVCFGLLAGRIDTAWPSRLNAPNQRELKHLESYVGSIEDTFFYARLRQAERDYRSWQANSGEPANDFENADYAITMGSHIAELAYNVYIKATQEYGIFTVFYADDDREFRSYYRSDRLFKETRILDKLNIPFCIFDER